MGQPDDMDPIDRFPQPIRDAHRASIRHRPQIEASSTGDAVENAVELVHRAVRRVSELAANQGEAR